MRRRQVAAVLVCFVLCALDGFDILAVTFAAPGIAADWSVGPDAIGTIIAAGLVGMVIGSLTLSQMADRIGRRRQILLCLSIMSAGMIASAFAPDATVLVGLRALTGVGLGAMLAAINAMAAEFANDRRRDLAVSVMAAGYPVGGVIGGWGAAMLLRDHGWEAIFIAGGIGTAIMVPVVLLLLPESISWIVARGGADALDRANAVLRRLGHPEAGRLVRQEQARPAMRNLFKGDLRVITLAMIAVYGLHMMTFYYALGWTPALVATLGFDPSSASIVSVFMNLGGAIGGVLLGLSAPTLGLKRLTLVGLFGAGVAVTIFGVIPADFNALKGGAFAFGFLANAAVVGLYALIARTYPTNLRATGTGAVIGFGRIGAALGPFIAGLLLAVGADRGMTSLTMSFGSVVAAAILLFFVRSKGEGRAS